MKLRCTQSFAVALIALFVACAHTAAAAPGQGEPCDAAGRCAAGLTCLRYRGVGGARGPELSSCEIPCAQRACPTGQRCVVIFDGPGQVCRPAAPHEKEAP